MMTAALIVVGLALLALAGEGLVRGAVSVAQRLGVSPFVIGALIVGFGTSAPELMTSVAAGLSGAQGVAIGNVVGSNIANVLLVAGVMALIRPVLAPVDTFGRDSAALLIATFIGAAALFVRPMPPPLGLFLVGGLGFYIWLTVALDAAAASPVRETHEKGAAHAVPPETREHPVLGWIYLIAGVVGVVAGANMLVSGASTAARAMGVSEAVIGLTIVAVGTSLPELAGSAMAALRGREDVALGNILGSCVFNILGILGVAALVSPISTPLEVLRIDVWVMGVSAVALVAMVWTAHRLSRVEGGLLLAAYAVYILTLASGAGRGLAAAPAAG